MDINRIQDEAQAYSGNLLRLGEGREIAVYLRDGVSWVADFRGGRGEIFTAGEWFRLNPGMGILRRAGFDAAAPLPARVIERIEQLHGMRESVVMPAAVAAAAVAGLCRGLVKWFLALIGRRPARPLHAGT